MLILKYLQAKSSFGWSLSNLAALLRQQLFIFRNLWADASTHSGKDRQPQGNSASRHYRYP